MKEGQIMAILYLKLELNLLFGKYCIIANIGLACSFLFVSSSLVQFCKPQIVIVT